VNPGRAAIAPLAGPAASGHCHPVRVYYEDTDAGGMVYHANYLKFAERARTELMRSIGFSHSQSHAESGIRFVVSRCAVEYRAAARLDDALTVTTTVARIGAATLLLQQVIRRDGELLAVLDIVVACIGREGRPCRLPPALRAALAAGGQPSLATPLSK